MQEHQRKLQGKWSIVWSCRQSLGRKSIAAQRQKPIQSVKCGCPYTLTAVHDPDQPDTVLFSETCWHANHQPETANGHLRMSENDKQTIKQFLEMGLPPRRILQFMNEKADRGFFSQSQPDSSSTAAYLSAWGNGRERFTLQQIENVRKHSKRLRQVDASDAASVDALLDHFKDSVIHQQPYRPATDELEEQPFLIVISHPWQQQLMYELGQELLLLDASGGTNSYGHMLHTLLVRDEWGNGLPVAFMICSAEDADPVTLFLKVTASAASRAAGGQHDSQQSLANSTRSLDASEQALRSFNAPEQHQVPAAAVADSTGEPQPPFAWGSIMIDKSRTEMAAIDAVLDQQGSSPGPRWLLCYFHMVQELERFLKSGDAGVGSKPERHRILVEMMDLKFIRDKGIFLRESAAFKERNACYPKVVHRYVCNEDREKAT